MNPLATLIDAPGIRAHLVPVLVTITRRGHCVHLTGQRLTMLAVLCVDGGLEPRAMAKFSLN